MTSENQAVVALRHEMKLLTRDLHAIAAGEAGSTFAAGDKAKLRRRIAALKAIIAKLDSAEASRAE